MRVSSESFWISAIKLFAFAVIVPLLVILSAVNLSNTFRLPLVKFTVFWVTVLSAVRVPDRFKVPDLISLS